MKLSISQYNILKIILFILSLLKQVWYPQDVVGAIIHDASFGIKPALDAKHSSVYLDIGDSVRASQISRQRYFRGRQYTSYDYSYRKIINDVILLNVVCVGVMSILLLDCQGK